MNPECGGRRGSKGRGPTTGGAWSLSPRTQQAATQVRLHAPCPTSHSSAATQQTGPQSRTATVLVGRRCFIRRWQRHRTLRGGTRRARPRARSPAPCQPLRGKPAREGHTTHGRPPIILKPREPESRCRTRVRLLVSSPWRNRRGQNLLTHRKQTAGIFLLSKGLMVPPWPAHIPGLVGTPGQGRQCRVC